MVDHSADYSDSGSIIEFHDTATYGIKRDGINTFSSYECANSSSTNLTTNDSNSCGDISVTITDSYLSSKSESSSFFDGISANGPDISIIKNLYCGSYGTDDLDDSDGKHYKFSDTST